ncbi:helix-turn-helix domain-containing protein [Gryllotalpicola protaetiae]|uniref:Uncharacterized protein n=1 Tax=Gryllotalpicola protaetiae TaxID=2419771 RepID=A0A387BJH7_9MICO|nr:helix-turn-helix domain-containing protein [Gryllotalpicola protaetiae]AYG02402.1 hypothetical protein D7I44_01855 [Gryllotalpicola protaetiae]
MASDAPHWVEVAARVRAEMARANLKVTEMMGVLHLARPTAYRLFHGQRPYDLQQLDLLAAWLGVDVEVLIGTRETAP